MLSRVAESTYWMARYIERAENVARFVDVNLHLLLDLPETFEGQWEALVHITGDEPDFKKRYDDASDENVIQFLTFDRDNPNSIVSCVSAARENARSVRDILTTDAWEALNEFYLSVTSSSAQKAARDDPHEFFSEVRRSGHRIEGAMSQTMSRGEPWHFARVGRLLERADKTTRILDIKYFLLLPDVSDVGTAIDDLHWSAVLRSASAFEMYRKSHGQVAAHRIIRFLLLDADFPRSVHYCLLNADDSLHAISGSPQRGFRNECERCLGLLVSELDYTDDREILRSGLHEYLDGMQAKLIDVGAALNKTFFELKPV